MSPRNNFHCETTGSACSSGRNSAMYLRIIPYLYKCDKKFIKNTVLHRAYERCDENNIDLLRYVIHK